MALIHSLEENGNKLFKYRGQIPVILFVMAIPVILFTDYESMSDLNVKIWTYSGICVSILGFIVRGITIGTTPKGTSGRNTKKQVAEFLNQTGIYSTLRHPLYLGNYLMWIGIVFFTMNIWFVVIVSLLYWIYYERIMFAEERFLEGKFGDDYINWSKTVPAFFPSFKNYKANTVEFSLVTVLRREYSGFLATVIGFYFVDLVRQYFVFDKSEFELEYFYILIIAATITVTLRSLKHYTKLLHREDRS
jgi:protein-S-isoprenylcysteine O-methyltransferase Ste14